MRQSSCSSSACSVCPSFRWVRVCFTLGIWGFLQSLWFIRAEREQPFEDTRQHAQHPWVQTSWACRHGQADSSLESHQVPHHMSLISVPSLEQLIQICFLTSTGCKANGDSSILGRAMWSVLIFWLLFCSVLTVTLFSVFSALSILSSFWETVPVCVIHLGIVKVALWRIFPHLKNCYVWLF